MRDTTTIRTATRSDASSVAEVLATAFADDPFNSWLLPDHRSRPARLQRGFGLLASRIYLPGGHGYMTSDGAGAALWSAPGQWRMSLRQQLGLLPGFAHTFGLGLPRALSGFAALDRRHPEDDEHWTLFLIGVRPEHQGRGIGARLLAPVLTQCDTDGTPVYLETSNPRNLRFYRHAGFEVREEFDLPHGPHIWTMWREARPAA